MEQLDAKIDHTHKIAILISKAYKKAVLLTPISENVRAWVEYIRMKQDEIEDAVKESYALAQTLQRIGDILKEEILLCD